MFSELFAPVSIGVRTIAKTVRILERNHTYAKILRKNNKAFIRDRESVLVWKTPIGSFVLAFDLTANGINGVYVDAEENYSLKEEVLFFRWVEESGRLLP